ncbi:MAG: alcohol dehydrogenase catalytic domain-containing protein [Thermoplasmatales archaeon]|nr:alcohol dehydrogenase catalytic domain-containing protein [Thermoplasmatales archaeon]
MRFARLDSGAVRLVEVPEPRAGPGELVVRMAACGVCGTDLEKLKGGYTASSILGHEPVGRISEAGEGVAGYAVGDRVFVHHHVPCGTCSTCARGDFTFCPTYQKTNLDPGGFAEAFRVSSQHIRAGAVLRLDPSVPWDEGSLLEPAGCVVTALRRVRFAPGASVFIYGLGPVGLLYARLARALGASWVGGAEISTLRRDVATAAGIDAVVDPRERTASADLVERATKGEGVDLAVVATGAPPAIEGAFRVVRRAGAVNLFGLPAAGSRLGADLQQLYLRGIRVIPTYATVEEDIREVHRLRVAGKLALADLVRDRFELADVAAAFERARDAERTVKVVVRGPAAG